MRIILVMIERLNYKKYCTYEVTTDLDSSRSNLRSQGFILHCNNLTAYTHVHSIFRE